MGENAESTYHKPQERILRTVSILKPHERMYEVDVPDVSC